MEQLTVATQKEAQGIEPGVAIIVLTSLHGEGVEQRRLDQPQRTEIEIVAYTALLIVDDGVILSLGFGDVVVVGIDHGGIRVRGNAQHAVEGSVAHLQLARLRL